MVAAILVLTGLAVALGLMLGAAALRWRGDNEPVIERVNARLPQTQCAQCGFPGCRPYATAIVAGEADINQCPPGGQQTIEALAELLGRPSKALNPANGVEKPRRLAVIDEQTCIGCTLCIQACPVDAIVGAARQMHTVIAAYCTGCELCLPPCPVDCIDLEPAPAAHAGRWPAPAALPGRAVRAPVALRSADAA